MASIYDKALKRKDYSGIVDKDKESEAVDVKAKGGKKSKLGALPKLDAPRAGAGVGKIVNLMSVDANKVRSTASGEAKL